MVAVTLPLSQWMHHDCLAKAFSTSPWIPGRGLWPPDQVRGRPARNDEYGRVVSPATAGIQNFVMHPAAMAQRFDITV